MQLEPIQRSYFILDLSYRAQRTRSAQQTVNFAVKLGRYLQPCIRLSESDLKRIKEKNEEDPT